MMWSNSSPTKGSHDGSEAFCWVKIPSIITMPTKRQDEDRDRVVAVTARLPAEPGAEVAEPAAAFGVGSSASGSLMGSPACRGRAAPTWPRPLLTSGTGFV